MDKNKYTVKTNSYHRVAYAAGQHGKDYEHAEINFYQVGDTIEDYLNVSVLSDEDMKRVKTTDSSHFKNPEMDKQDLNRLRNAIHNEAGVTKQEIREMVEKAVEHLVDKRVKQLLPDEISMDKMVDSAIKNRSLYWLSKEEAFDDRVIKEVAKILSKKVELKLGIKGSK